MLSHAETTRDASMGHSGDAATLCATDADAVTAVYLFGPPLLGAVERRRTGRLVTGREVAVISLAGKDQGDDW